jgi:hypothetical protein
MRVERSGWRVIFTAAPGAHRPEIGFAAQFSSTSATRCWKSGQPAPAYVELLEQLVRDFLAT